MEVACMCCCLMKFTINNLVDWDNCVQASKQASKQAKSVIE